MLVGGYVCKQMFVREDPDIWNVKPRRGRKKRKEG
jgi:hypothetical protein